MSERGTLKLLKSNLTKICPPEEIALPPEFSEIRIERREIQAEIDHLRENCQTIDPAVDSAKPGDFITVCGDAGERTLNTGRCFGGIAPLARACMGKRIGETVALNGAEWTLKRVARKVLPPFDDALLEHAGIPGIDSAAAYVRKIQSALIEKKKNAMTEETVDYAAGEMIKRSQYALDASELAEIAAETDAMVQDSARQNDTPPEAVAEEFLTEFGMEANPAADWRAKLMPVNELLLKTIVLGEHYLAQYGLRLSQEQYENYLAAQSKKEGCTPEKMRETVSYWTFLYQKYDAQVRTAAKRSVEPRIQWKIKEEN